MFLTRSRSDVITSVANSNVFFTGFGCVTVLMMKIGSRAALVQTETVRHPNNHTITSSSVSFRLHYICHLMLGNVVVTPAS